MKNMECSLCGNEFKHLNKALVEGTVIDVCDDCLKFGTKITQKEEYRAIKRDINFEPIRESEYELISHYGQAIRQARKNKNLTREDFAKVIREKDSVIKRIEEEEMHPNEELTKKIEKFFGIKLMEKYQEERIQKKKEKKELTLGDIVKIK